MFAGVNRTEEHQDKAFGAIDEGPCQVAVSESDPIWRKISPHPSAVNWEHLQAAWVFLKATDRSAQRLLLRGHG